MRKHKSNRIKLLSGVNPLILIADENQSNYEASREKKYPYHTQ